MTVRATVADVLSPRSFTLTSPDDPEVGPVLAVTTEQAADVQPQDGEEVLVAATVANEFEAERVSQELSIPLEGDRYGEWDGEMYPVVAMVEPAT